MKNVKINGVTYSNVPSVEIPLASDPSQTATFLDTDIASDGATAGDILSGKKGYVNGWLITGSIATKTSSDLTVSGATVTAPAGYYSSSASKSVASGSATTPDTSITANPSIAIDGNDATKIKATVSASQSITPTVSAGYVSSGTAGTATVSGEASISAQSLDQYLVASNIKSGVTIFGIAGSLTGATISQDSTTKVLSIS